MNCRELKDYIVNINELLFTTFKVHTQSWARLPLGVTVRKNLVKMILLPKFLYIFWHSQALLNLKIFTTIDRGLGRHKLPWLILKNLTTVGRTALSDFHSYYLEAQLSHFYHLDNTEFDHYQMLVCRQSNQVPYSPLQVIKWVRGREP